MTPNPHSLKRMPLVQTVTKYVTPEKVYVLHKNGTPYMVVQNRQMAEFFKAVDGGTWTLVPWFDYGKFYKELAEPTEVTYDNYEPSFTNPGDYVYRPQKRPRF